LGRRFADLHIRCPISGADNLRPLLESARTIGYRHVAVEFGPGSMNQTGKVEEICNGLDLEVSTRVDLDPRDGGSLQNMLRHHRGRFDIVAGVCRNHSVARQAALDPRVDLLEFPHDPRERKLVNFSNKEAELAANRSCALELDFSAMLRADEIGQARLLSIMRTELSIALDNDVRVIVTSGAGDLYGLRAPRDLASFLGLLGANWQTCLDAVSTSPLQVVARKNTLIARLDRDRDTR